MSIVNGLVNKLLEFSQQKLRLMEQILLLSRQMLADPEFDKIEKHLVARQQYIDQVDQLDQQIQLLKDRLVAETGVVSWAEFKKQHPEMLTSLEPIVVAISQAAFEAKELTDKSQVKAEQKLNELKLEMRKMQSSKTGMAAYHNKPKQQSGYFLDKKK